MDQSPYQPPQQNPYDFITNPSQPPKRPLFGGGSLRSRIIIVVGGVLLIMIIGTIVSSLIANANKGPTEQLKSIVAQQQELIRIADEGTDDALSINAKAFAATVKLSVQTDQKKLQEQLSSLGIGLKPEELSAKKSTATDEALRLASANNRYDEELTETLTEQLNSYASALQSAFNASKSSTTKTVLSEAYTSTGNLIGL